MTPYAVDHTHLRGYPTPHLSSDRGARDGKVVRKKLHF